jgi:GNAT superfamily N-acetyltransferase
MSLYADYVKEREGKFIIEDNLGFAVYTISGEVCYIVDIYVVPDQRKNGLASSYADLIVEAAKEAGCTKLLGSVDPTTNGATASLKVLLAYGFSLSCIDDNLIYFVKDI